MTFWQTPEYNSWASMKSRCQNPNYDRYQYYGARGIQVCDRWQRFENFLADMGKRPSPKHTLDRIDVNGNYEPGNCRWATQVEQLNNRRNVKVLVLGDEARTSCEWDRVLSRRIGTTKQRIDRGWSVSEMLNRYGKSNRSKERRRWHRELSEYWKANPMYSCEVRLVGCLHTFGLAPAHSKKRRYIQTKEDYFEVVAACQNCHRQLDEKMSHEQMEAKVKEIINARQLQFM